MNKQDKIIRASVIEQPLEGLLYDLDLMPEECRNTTANMRRVAIEVLRKEIERLRNNLEKFGEHLQSCNKLLYEGIKDRDYCTCGLQQVLRE